LPHLHLAHIGKLAREPSGYLLKRLCVLRLCVARRLNGLVVGLFNFVALLQLALLEPHCEVVVAKILLRYLPHLLYGNGVYYVFVLQQDGEVSLVDKAVEQVHRYHLVRLHRQVELAYHIALYALQQFLVKLAVFQLFYFAKQNFLYRFERLKPALVHIVKRHCANDNAPLAFERHRLRVGKHHIAVNGYFVEQARARTV